MYTFNGFGSVAYPLQQCAAQRHAGSGTTTVPIVYLGFQPSLRGRDYVYRVSDPKLENREFTFTISAQSFAEGRIPYQDAPDMCYQKLQKALELETAEYPLPRHSTLSDRELDEYRESHRPAKRGTQWTPKRSQ